MKQKSDIWRGIIGFILGVILIFFSINFAKKLVANKKKPKQRIEKKVNKIFTQTVANNKIPLLIPEKGSLKAMQKVELYSEVQGLLRKDNQLIKPGQVFEEGSIIYSIDDSEFRASLIAQKSTLYNLITQVMPDLKLDYPDVFSKWQDYLNRFDIKRSIPAIPTFSNDREKYFINSKQIVTTYYNIKNLEERHRKYIITSPFAGIMTESFVNPGALVRPGQKLGTILSPTDYEMVVSVDLAYEKYLRIGKQVALHNLDHSKKWYGKITRINPTLNAETQGIQVYIQVSGKSLKEGMFLEAAIEGKAIEKGYELSRKLIVENNKTYSVEEGKLKLIPLEIAYFKQNSAVVTNLNDDTVLLKNPIPGAYDGMLVQIVESQIEE